MLQSFNYMSDEVDIASYYDIWQCIQDLKWYFYKFAGYGAEEAMQRTLLHAVAHFNTERGSLQGYIKKLAREICKDNGKTVPVDFLEDSLADSEDSIGSSFSGLNKGNIPDFANDLISGIYATEKRHVEVVNLALSFVDRFVVLCKALQSGDTHVGYFPEVFIKECLRVSRSIPNFNEECGLLYEQYGEEMEEFLEFGKDVTYDWIEADFASEVNEVSKRVRFIDPKTNTDVVDADVSEFYVYGSVGNKKICKVPYHDVWDFMCDWVDSKVSNPMKLVIGDSCVIRTFGGSYSFVNPDLYNLYNTCRSEIVTNLVRDMFGRVINVGSSNVYMLCHEVPVPHEKRTIYGYTFGFEYEDITGELVK